MKNIRNKSKSGFSLVELMVVVAIVGLLANISYTSFKKLQIKARSVEGQTGLKSLAMLQQLYFDANGHYCCPFPDSITSFSSENPADYDSVSDTPDINNPLGFSMKGDPRHRRYGFHASDHGSDSQPDNVTIAAVELFRANPTLRRVAPGCGATEDGSGSGNILVDYFAEVYLNNNLTTRSRVDISSFCY
jgi:prepilin-type N-terminal cleavage/methylation domain-containing protein